MENLINKITENEIERFTIELLESLGFKYIYAPNITPENKNKNKNG